jgi:hypothetical protein
MAARMKRRDLFGLAACASGSALAAAAETWSAPASVLDQLLAVVPRSPAFDARSFFQAAAASQRQHRS